MRGRGRGRVVKTEESISRRGQGRDQGGERGQGLGGRGGRGGGRGGRGGRNHFGSSITTPTPIKKKLGRPIGSKNKKTLVKRRKSAAAKNGSKESPTVEHPLITDPPPLPLQSQDRDLFETPTEKTSCDDCHITFDSLEEKKKHLVFFHLKVSKIKIRDSSGKTLSFSLLYDEDGMLVCPICHASFAQKQGAKRHLKIHIETFEENKEPGQSIANSFNTDGIEYMTIENDPPSDNMIQQQQQLLLLPPYTEPSLPTYQIACTECPLSFESQDILNAHYFFFHEETYYITSESNFNEIFRFIITRVNGLIKCPLCLYKCQNLSTLNTHIQSRHELTVWISQEKLQNNPSAIEMNQNHMTLKANENGQAPTHLYEPALSLEESKPQRSLWQTIKSFF